MPNKKPARRKVLREAGAGLTGEDKIKAAYFYYVKGISQQNLAELFGVNNGRINEACKAVGAAVGLNTPGYQE